MDKVEVAFHVSVMVLMLFAIVTVGYGMVAISQAYLKILGV